MTGIKQTNEYARELAEIYDRTPKAVLAAIAVSYATCGGDRMDEATQAILDEWKTLYEQGIVPQKPVKVGG